MIVTLAWFIVAILAGYWLLGYYREQDAADATSSVAGGVVAVLVGAFASLIVIFENGALALSLVGDQLAVYAPWLAHGAITAVGWFAFDRGIVFDPMTWLAMSAGMVVLTIMMVRQ